MPTNVPFTNDRNTLGTAEVHDHVTVAPAPAPRTSCGAAGRILRRRKRSVSGHGITMFV